MIDCALARRVLHCEYSLMRLCTCGDTGASQGLGVPDSTVRFATFWRGGGVAVVHDDPSCMPSSSSFPPSWYSQALLLQHDALRRLSLVLQAKRRCFLCAPVTWAMVRRTAHQTYSVHSRRRGRLVWMR
ncbi:hypothetical protein BU14_0081s0017 [Porphyra umbilicalis]|uniref:Uncharacterized protein n=1 Tax=Porphyra umbilicalis TaxID=2786 RepID=A0A1X6PEP7_PORUM|nr:hypothetical protein BU14_0081s0017 [Porphyra umbilicalis]|eukprot:OSX79337.1 hypothetical protein BU14_0081s0017 [Porphyra umbilicalis]